MSHLLESVCGDVEVSNEFYEWLMKFDPTSWDHGYSGDIYGLWKAWEAGAEVRAKQIDRIRSWVNRHCETETDMAVALEGVRYELRERSA